MDVMEVMTSLVHKLNNFVFSLRLLDVVDILVVAYLIYRLLLLVRKTNSSRLLKGVLVVIAALWLSTDRLPALNFALTHVVEWGVLALIILFQPETPLPRLVSASAGGCYFRGDGTECSLKIPIFEEELKYFYSNYQDYYYLPTEDVALHKSVAGFVDKAYRLQASAANCYTRKVSSYLPQWDFVFSPFFKRDYKSRELFFELTDELKKNRQAFSVYASHVLSMMASSY